jgi:hypothetical protein
MGDWSEELKEDIVEVREKVKKTRIDLTEGVEEKAKAAGKSVADFSKESYTKLETSMDKVTDKLSSGAYKFSEKTKHEVGELAVDLKKLKEKVREERRNVTGGTIEDKTKETLNNTELKLKNWINKMKE